MRLLGVLAVAALILAVTAGCDDEQGGESSAGPTLTPTVCPPEVDNVLMGGYTCSFLTVPGSRDKAPARLLVTKIEPTDGAKHDDPLVSVGEDLATTINYAGLAPAADRLGRTLWLLNPRGVTGSEPDLGCPDADADQTGWVDAVASCAQRFEAEGVDLDAVNQATLASDVIALTQAAGMDEWNLGSWGTSGRVGLEVLRANPPGLRSVFLDSPELPSANPLSTAAEDTRAALGRVLADCAADAGCRSLPHTLIDVDRIVAELENHPWVRTVATADERVRMEVDGDLVVRILRHMISNNGASYPYLTAGAVPATLAALDGGRQGSLDETILAPMAASPANCEGYVPSCQSFHHMSVGSYLSVICPGVSGGGVAGQVGAIGRTYEESPYVEACADWPVDHETADDPVTSDVPVLVLAGRYDPYADLDRLRDGLAGLSRLQLVEVPAWGRNAVGSGDCVNGIRNDFIADPDQRDISCVADLPERPNFLPRL